MKKLLILLLLLNCFRAHSQGCSTIPLTSTVNQWGYACNLNLLLNTSAPLTIQDWQYIVITKDNSNNGKLYKNGQLIYSGSYANLTYSWNKIILGAVFLSSYNGFFKGWIDEIRMSNAVLSAQDVLTNYNANQALSATANTIGLWHFDQSTGTTIYASVGTSGTTTNATWDANGKFGSCLYYNGVNARADILQTIPISNMSFEFWIKPEVNQVDKWPVSWYGGNTSGFILNTDTTTTYYVNNLITQDTIKACGDSVLVSATTGLTSYLWNTGATSSSIYAKNTGWYNVKTINASGCNGFDSVFVSILKANILNNDTTVCLGASLTLNAQQATIGTSCTKSGLATNLQNGLVGYWPFCGNANDMSGNGNNGTVNGATLTTDRFGNANSAYSFNGVNNVINIANSNSLNPSQISICAWYKPNQDNLCILEKSNTNSPMENSYGITHNDGWQIPRGLKTSIGVGNCGPYSHATSNTTWGPLNQITNNIWQFIVVTIDNNGLTKQYINGILNYSSTINPLICCNSSTSNLRFGKHWDGDPEWFNGKLDDIAIWNRALSASEVTQLYQASAYATTYLWSTGATTASINVNPTQTTKYWLQVSNGISTCTDTVTITVQNPAAPAVNNVSYCQGATASVLTATASAGNSLMWYSTATGGAGSSTAPIPSTTTVGTTTYYVSQITPQGCESVRASLTVTVNALPQASITASKTPIICTGDSVVFSVSPQVAGQSYVWYKDGVIINGASSTSYAAKQSGAYSVRVTNSNGCSITTATSTLNVYPWPTVNAGPDKEVPAGTSVDIITQTSNAQSIAWSPITGLSCTNCASPTATVNFPIVYIVTVTSAGGCSVSDTVEIQLVCEEDLLYMPNTFSPNGDGENDRFYPMGKGLGEVTVFRIVNRLGQVVYTRSRFAINNASYGWDGTLNGADLGMDVYSYYIEVPCATGQIIKKTGDISLLR